MGCLKLKYYSELTFAKSCKSVRKDYMFGFNGMQKDNEVKGVGNSLDFGARIYDSRLGRFLSLDPYSAKFANESNFSFAGNSPIKFIDKDGEFKIEASIKDNYPLVYLYMSTQLENDLKKQVIRDAYKNLNPAVTDARLNQQFTNGIGPSIGNSPWPGNADNATGHTDYQENSNHTLILINNRIFSYVEGVLKSPKSTQEEKLLAKMYLFQVITHEYGHDANGYYKDKQGNERRLTPAENSDKELGSGDWEEQGRREPGYIIDKLLWGMPSDTDDTFTADKWVDSQPHAFPQENERKGRDRVGGSVFRQGEMKKYVDKTKADPSKREALPTSN
jgi:RHS repeat-associated protein